MPLNSVKIRVRNITRAPAHLGQHFSVTFHIQRRKSNLWDPDNIGFRNLPVSRFTRVHKSYLFSIRHITAVRKNIVFIKDPELPIGEPIERR